MFNYEDYAMFCRLNRISESKYESIKRFAQFVGHKSKLEEGVYCV